MRQRRFDGANFKSRKLPENAATPTTCPGILCRGSVHYPDALPARCVSRLQLIEAYLTNPIVVLLGYHRFYFFPCFTTVDGMDQDGFGTITDYRPTNLFTGELELSGLPDNGFNRSPSQPSINGLL